jgi:hypothetical protein
VTATYLIPPLLQRWVDGNGNALFNGQIATYQAGTLTPITTYKDSTLSSPNTNPVILNTRGEAAIWQIPNVATKFIVSDSLGNLIATIDNVVNSQLLTLYGGVDTGSVNAYILNFTANFTAYSDGIVIKWIPANTNTGASTININGLGVINITNSDGSALVAGEIIAAQPTEILIKAGAALLTTPATTVYGTFTATWSGFSAAPALTTVTYRKNGSQVTLIFPITTGTSNAITFIMSGLPALLKPVSLSATAVPIVGLIDNGVSLAGGLAQVFSATGQVQFWKDGTQPNWTAAGAKGFSVQASITYST